MRFAGHRAVWFDIHEPAAAAYRKGPSSGRFPGLRAVLFDFDDTLVSSSVADAGALRATLEHFAPRLGLGELADLAAHHERILADVKRVYRETGEWAYPEERLARLLEERGADRAHAPAMGGYYYEARLARLHPYPGARELLVDLRAKGLALGIVTNAPARQRRWLDVLGFSDLVDGIVIAGEAGVRKPDPRIFQMAREAVGSPAWSETLMVGDSYDNDVAPARALGMRTCYVAGAPTDVRSRLFDERHAPPPGECDLVVERAAELAAHV